jgi:hypothetical protein
MTELLGADVLDMVAKAKASDPRFDPEYAMRVMKAISKEVERMVEERHGTSEGIHPYIYAVAYRLGPKHPALDVAIDIADPFDMGSDNTLILISQIQSQMYHLGCSPEDIKYMDRFAQVFQARQTL